MSKSISPAAILFDEHGQVDVILRGVTKTLGNNGARIEGYIQTNSKSEENCCSDMWLEDISDGEKFRISQPLGPGSKGCRLDSHALAEACERMEQRLDTRTELLVLNRFGKGESDGQGFRSVIIKAIEFEIPVLVAVRDVYFDAWKEFCGADCHILQPDEKAVRDWAINAVDQFRAKQMVA